MRSRLLSIVLATVVVGLLGSAPAAMAGSTYYASPTGSGSECSEGHRCKPEEAAKKAQDGDSVLLAPGTYELTGQVDVVHAVEFGGESTAAATILKSKNGATLIDDNVGAHLHDVSVVGTGSFLLNSGTAERLYVSISGSGPIGCSLSASATSTPVLRDSVCWLHNSTVPGASAIHLSGNGVARLYNDDAISTATGGIGLRLEPSGASKVTVEATNSIFRGSENDVLITASGGSAAVLANSNFTTAVAQSGNSVTAPGSGANQTIEPHFVNAAEGDFYERADSVTIGAGLFSTEIGPLDLARKPRSQGGSTCQGAPDIGAYEFEETTPACAPPPGQQPSSAATIKLGKLKLNRQKGTATLSVSISGAGKVTLSGAKVKKATKSAKGAVTLSLPVGATGKAAKKLSSAGKAKLKLSVRFAPANGAAVSQSRSVTLVKKIARASH